MKATILDLRRRMREVLDALARNEPVTLLHRGKKKGVIYPAGTPENAVNASAHRAFGMWKDHPGLGDVDKHVREIRKGRAGAI